MLQTEAERASLAPFGHIAWTAILGGAIFASAWSTGRFRLDRRVLWTFLGVAALHACWDASYGYAIRITEGLDGEGWKVGWPDTAAWVGTPTGTDLLRFQVVYAVLQGLLSLIGLIWAIRRWRRYRIDRCVGSPSEAVARRRAAVRDSVRAGAGGLVLDQREDSVRPVGDVIERLLIANRQESRGQRVELALGQRAQQSGVGGSFAVAEICLGLPGLREADELIAVSPASAS